MKKPHLMFTLGDVAGIGPEIILRGWHDLLAIGKATVIGSADRLSSTARSLSIDIPIREVPHLKDRIDGSEIQVLNPSQVDLSRVEPGRVSAEAGQAAFDYLCFAIRAVQAGEADAIVTCPLHKEGLHAAGLPYPGHTEILAELTNTTSYAMLLYGRNIVVAHVTLHMALREVFAHLSIPAIVEKIRLLHRFTPLIVGRSVPLAVCALNPHGSDGGLFGDEEERIITPAVESARAAGIPVAGPFPSDTLFRRAASGEFGGILAMYHDQGHIPMKLRCGTHLVNITAGLPIIRTSVAHGTAYDIVGTGKADPGSLVEAARIAVNLVQSGWESSHDPCSIH